MSHENFKSYDCIISSNTNNNRTNQFVLLYSGFNPKSDTKQSKNFPFQVLVPPPPTQPNPTTTVTPPLSTPGSLTCRCRAHFSPGDMSRWISGSLPSCDPDQLCRRSGSVSGVCALRGTVRSRLTPPLPGTFTHYFLSSLTGRVRVNVTPITQSQNVTLENSFFLLWWFGSPAFSAQLRIISRGSIMRQFMIP